MIIGNALERRLKKIDVGNGVPFAKGWCVNVSKNVFTNKNPIGVCVPVSADVVTYLGIRTRLKEHHGKLQVFIGSMFNYLHAKVMVRLILRLQERQYFLLFTFYSRQLLSYEAGTKPFFCRRVDLVRSSTLSSF